jgi:hypothetical protein
MSYKIQEICEGYNENEEEKQYVSMCPYCKQPLMVPVSHHILDTPWCKGCNAYTDKLPEPERKI